MTLVFIGAHIEVSNPLLLLGSVQIKHNLLYLLWKWSPIYLVLMTMGPMGEGVLEVKNSPPPSSTRPNLINRGETSRKRNVM